MRRKKAAATHDRRSNLARVRAKGMRSAGRITRVTAAASVVLTVVFSAVAALGFSGYSKSTASSAAGSTSAAGGPAVRLALPPKGQGGTLAAPTSLPVQNAPAPPAVTSGGS
jgi:hypothetical protein